MLTLKALALRGLISKGITFDDKAIWPTKEKVAKAVNVPVELQKHLERMSGWHDDLKALDMGWSLQADVLLKATVY